MATGAPPGPRTSSPCTAGKRSIMLAAVIVLVAIGLFAYSWS